MNKAGNFESISKPAAEDLDEITSLWERSVRATHDFLKEEDIEYFKPLVRNQYLGMVSLYCIRDDKRIKGFLGLSEDKIEMLFIDPDCMGQGIGGSLMKFAVYELGYKKVDVNEQNKAALRFYKYYGFKEVGRTELDATGKNYPILYLELK